MNCDDVREARSVRPAGVDRQGPPVGHPARRARAEWPPSALGRR